MCTARAKDTRTRQPVRPVMSKKQGIHALENLKDTDNQTELYFDKLEINILGTAGNTDGTHGASATEMPVSTLHEPAYVQTGHRHRRKSHTTDYL